MSSTAPTPKLNFGRPKSDSACFGRPKPAADGPEPAQPGDGGFASDLAAEIIKYSGLAKPVPDDGITIASFAAWTVEDIVNHQVLSEQFFKMSDTAPAWLENLLEIRGVPALAWVLYRSGLEKPEDDNDRFRSLAVSMLRMLIAEAKHQAKPLVPLPLVDEDTDEDEE